MIIDSLQNALGEITTCKPLVFCLTNHVSMEFTANVLLALGAVPLMSEAEEETEALLNISQALYVNIGTLDSSFLKRATRAAKKAARMRIPTVLDPAGAGASPLRSRAAGLLIHHANIVRGNASEIMALENGSILTRGVEAAHAVHDASPIAERMARNHAVTVIVSGAEDFLTDGVCREILPYGNILMTRITGMGCAFSAAVAAFAATIGDCWQAARHATAFFGLCGELAAQKSPLPGSFRQHFIDMLYSPDWHAIQNILDKKQSCQPYPKY